MLYNKMEQSVVQQFMRYDAAKASRLVKAEATTTKHQRRVRFSCRSVICDELRRIIEQVLHTVYCVDSSVSAESRWHEIAFAVCGLVMTLPCIAGWSTVGSWYLVAVE